MSELLKRLEDKLATYKVIEFHILYADTKADNPDMNTSNLYELVQDRHHKLYLAAEGKRKVLRMAIKREIEDIEIRKAHVLVDWKG